MVSGVVNFEHRAMLNVVLLLFPLNASLTTLSHSVHTHRNSTRTHHNAKHTHSLSLTLSAAKTM